MEHPLLSQAKLENATPAVNGLKIFGNVLYASNTQNAQMVRVPIQTDDQPGEPDIFVPNVNIDDFAFDRAGNLYGTTHVFNSVVKITPDGSITTIAQADQGMTGTAAVAFGRLQGNLTHLYVTTNGGMSFPPPTGIEAAKVVCLGVVLMEKIQDETLTSRSLGNLLEYLLVNQIDQAKAFAESLLNSLPPDNTGEARAKAIVAAEKLMVYAEDAGWSVVWSAVQQDPEFGREVMESVSYLVKYQGSFEQKLREDCLANLYIFLARQYLDIAIEEENEEGSQDAGVVGVEAHIVGSEDSVRTWRDYIPQRLQERGTPQACEALRKIICELPELKDKLQWRLLEAEALTRRQTWQPPQPEQILRLVSSRVNVQSTYIQTGVLIMPESSNPNLNFSGSVGAVNVNSTVHGDQIGTQHNYAQDQEQDLVKAYDEIQQIFNRLTQTHLTATETDKQIIVAKAVEQAKQNPTLRKRFTSGGKAFIFEALQKASDQWWVSPFVKAIEAGIKGE